MPLHHLKFYNLTTVRDLCTGKVKLHMNGRVTFGLITKPERAPVKGNHYFSAKIPETLNRLSSILMRVMHEPPRMESSYRHERIVNAWILCGNFPIQQRITRITADKDSFFAGIYKKRTPQRPVFIK